MADHHHHFTNTNWWDTTRTSASTSGSLSSSTCTSSSSQHHHSSLSSFSSWPTENTNMVDVNQRSSSSIDQHHHTSSFVFHDMGLGLSSPTIDWNQTLLSDKGESSFRPMLHENLNTSTNYQHEAVGSIGSTQVQWREINRGFSLNQPQFSPHGNSSDSTITCQGLQLQPSGLMQIDSTSIYGPNPSLMLQGLLGSHENQPQQQCPLNYQYGGSGNSNFAIRGGSGGSNNEYLPSSWSKVPQFLKNSPPKNPSNTQLQFSNNTSYWNPSATIVTDQARSSFFQPQFPTASSFDLIPKQNISEVRDSSTVAKKSGGSEAASSTTKRPRNETQSSSPAFKVRKEKMGDRITALQQLVSPFGKTDTASVLSEAIEYIKFLHEQVNVLSTPYMKSGGQMQHQQGSDKSKNSDSAGQDLRSRGLCLVPVSSTFPVTHETTVDFWTPTFGGTFR